MTPVVALVALALAEGVLQIEHQPLTCVRLDQYARVTAKAEPAAEVAAAELQFRAGQTGWYRTPMARTVDGWTALLPRPTTARDAFEYRVAFTSVRAEEVAATRSTMVPVTTTCAAAAESAVATAIVVRVPEGVPVVPPVPAGFSPTGVVSVEAAAAASKMAHPATGSMNKPLVIAAAGGVAAAAIAGIASAGEDPKEPEADLPTARFNVTVPPPGSTVSVSSGTLSVIMLLDHIPTVSPVFDWIVELLGTPSEPPCVVMGGRFGSISSIGIVLTAPMVRGPGCTLPADTSFLRVVLAVDGRPVHSSTTEAPFHFVP
jgi:hypothetical protein